MSYEPFENDRSWVKFKCLELASEVNKYRGANAIIEAAIEFERFVMPRASVLEIKGGRHAAQNHKE